MLTYQDLLEVNPEDEKARMEFCRNAIRTHENSDLYKTAILAHEYDCKQNRTIVQYQKLLYDVSGKVVPDNFSANYKICSAFFSRFVTQDTQYLLGNGVTWNNEDTADKLGDDFDNRLQEIGHEALVGGVAFGFWNFDHLEVFNLREFVPLYDEETGALSAGIRYWQIDRLKPLRATLYELDGYTEYMWDNDGARILKPKTMYKTTVRISVADGLEILDGENYPTFPIVPLWGNRHRQSEIIGIQQSIDAYDLIKSGFANDIDDASLIYWTINNAGGMDDIDLAQFVQHMRTVRAAVVSETGASAEAHSMDVPFASREAMLNRIRSDLYDDFMALDTKIITGGAATATQIKAAYEPLNSKVDEFEYCVNDFLQGILELAGIEDEPSFTRSMIVNANEEVQIILQSAEYLGSEYVTRKILTLLGDVDQTEEILEAMRSEESRRLVDENRGTENESLPESEAQE